MKRFLTITAVLVGAVICNIAGAQNRADKDYVIISDGPAPTKRVKPQYPDLARKARVQGDVVCELIIGRKGRVERARLLSGHPLLADAALQAVKQWEWKPLVFGKKTYRVRQVVVVTFSLSSDT